MYYITLINLQPNLILPFETYLFESKPKIKHFNLFLSNLHAIKPPFKYQMIQKSTNIFNSLKSHVCSSMSHTFVVHVVRKA